MCTIFLHNILWFWTPQLNWWFCEKKYILFFFKVVAWKVRGPPHGSFVWGNWVITHYSHSSHIAFYEIFLPSHWVFSKMMSITQFSLSLYEIYSVFQSFSQIFFVPFSKELYCIILSYVRSFVWLRLIFPGEIFVCSKDFFIINTHRNTMSVSGSLS